MGGPHGIRGLGEFIRQRRIDLGMTQDDLASAIDAPRGYISQIETGNKRWPAKYIPAIASVLNCSTSELREAAFASPESDAAGLSDDDISRIADAVIAKLSEGQAA